MQQRKAKSQVHFKKFFFSKSGGLHFQPKKGKGKSFIFPAFSLVRVSRKETLKEFETAIKIAPHFLKADCYPFCKPCCISDVIVDVTDFLEKKIKVTPGEAI